MITDCLLFSDITNTCVLPLLLCKQEKNGLIRLQLLISQHTQTHTKSLTMRTGSRAYIIWAAFSLRRPHQLTHTIIFSMSPSSSNLTVMVQRGLRLDLPSGPGCSLKYLPCSHFSPHLNTSSILGHYSGSVCPAHLSLRLVCACGCESDTVGMDTIVPRGHVGL